MKKEHIGSNFDDFLAQENLLAECEAGALKRVVIAGQRAWPDFGQRLRSIYGDKVAPDLQTIIDNGRGGN